MLTTTDDNKLDTSTVDPNLLAAGQSGGKTYGTPIGANTLALYYNKEVLKEAGVDIASVKDWASLTAALEKVKKAGKKGITFSGDRHRGGQLPVPAVVLGLGRRPDRPRLGRGGRRAVAVEGLARARATPPTRSSTTPRPPAGRSSPPATTRSPRTAPGSSPTPRRPASTTASSPSRPPTAATPPAPTGGEFVTIPVQEDTGRYATSQKLVDLPDQHRQPATTPTPPCPTSPPTGEVQDKQVAANAELEALGRRGQGGQGPHQRRPGHQVPEDLRAAVEGRPVRAQRRRSRRRTRWPPAASPPLK